MKRFKLSWIPKKNSAEELKLKVEDLKLLYFARLQGLFELAQSYENSANLVLDKMNYMNSNHANELQNLLRDAVLEAELVLQDLEGTLLKQQNEIAAFAQQQRERVHNNLQATKEIAKATLNAFDQLGRQAIEVSHHIDDCCSVQESSLAEFERTFEEQARQEEQHMLQEIASLFLRTKVQKSALVHDMVSTLREHSAAERLAVHNGMKAVTNLACATQSQWESFLHQAEATSAKEVGQLAARHCEMEALIQDCMKGRDNAIKQWEKAQHLVEQCTKIHLPVTESVVREAKQNNGRLQEQLDQEFLAAEVELETCTGSVIAHMQRTTNFDNEAQQGLHCQISNQLQTLTALQSCHHTKVEELQRFSTGCFEDIKEDQPTNLTPKRREIHIPSKASLEELCAPSADTIIRKFKERMGRIAKENAVTGQGNFITKPSHLNEAPPTRIPLARLN